MSIFSKIMTAVRGGATEAGQAIVDANAIRIFEQEIRDSENAIEKGKRDLTGVMADKIKEERKAAEITKDKIQMLNNTIDRIFMILTPKK